LGLTEAFDQVYYGEKGNRIPSILSTSFWQDNYPVLKNSD
jgi:hypothetical protein